MRQRILSLARSLGLEIRSARRHPNLADFLKNRRIEVVYDVGANVGQFAKQIRASGYAGDIVSFEPLSEAHAVLRGEAAADPRWTIFNTALGAMAERRDIQVSEASVFSSFLDKTKLAETFDQRARVIATESITIQRFDEFKFDLRTKRSFLKIDTQGFEQSVLEGAANSLPDFHGVLLELPIEPLYEPIWTLADALACMSAHGFSLAQVNPVNALPDDWVCAMEFDCLFRRTAT